ncbi:MAG: glycosyltransferase family 39 protein [Pyrinomonadaceae bacterium]|nr:glycosyltransferase family 39 protein [Phycisphaerales bacterium]
MPLPTNIPQPGPSASETPRIAGSFRAVLLFVGALTLLRVAYLFVLCPYDLVEDEANYWQWSRNLEWSYYTKGPGIALAIRAATEIFGTSEAAIRMVAVLSNMIATLAVAAMAGLAAGRTERPRGQQGTSSTTPVPAGTAAPSMSVSSHSGGTPPLRLDARVAFFAACAFQLTPIFQATGLLATIDGPYTACWAVACLGAMVALLHARRWGWLVCGVAIGLGFLAKYTILLLVPGLLLFAILGRAYLVLGRHWLPYLLGGAMLMLAGFLPVLVWNQQNDWPTVAHLLGHLGMRGGDMPVTQGDSEHGGWHYDPRWTLTYIGSQIGMVGPLLILAVCIWIDRFRRVPKVPPSRIEHPLRAITYHHPGGTLLLICCAAPILAFYLVVSFVAEPEGNWAMGAYVTLLSLAGWGASDAMEAFHRKVSVWRALPRPRPREGVIRAKPETVPQVLWHFALVFGLLSGIGMLRLDWMMIGGVPLLQWGGSLVGVNPEKLAFRRGQNLFDADRMGMSAYEHALLLKEETGSEPFYVAKEYGPAAMLAFYVPGHPIVRCSGGRMGGRPTPSDFWPAASLDDPALVGRPALLVGGEKSVWEPMFERVTQVETASGQLTGEHKQHRPAFLAYGYKGWQHVTDPEKR